MIRYTFDVGGTSIKGIKFLKDKEEEKFHLFYDDLKSKFGRPLQHVLELIDEVISFEKDEFQLGISFPGGVDTKNYRITRKSAIVDFDIDIKKFFSKNSKIQKLIIENDGNSATLGEYSKIEGTKPEHFALIALGTGIACGIIINGKLYHGANLLAGELGQLTYKINAKDKSDKLVVECSTVANCLKYEVIKNKLDITQMTRDTISKLINGKELMKKYLEKDEIAINIVTNWTKNVALLVYNLAVTLDIGLIALGGGISADKNFSDLVLEEYEILSKKMTWQYNKLVMAKLKNDAACYGVLEKLKNYEY